MRTANDSNYSKLRSTNYNGELYEFNELCWRNNIIERRMTRITRSLRSTNYNGELYEFNELCWRRT